MFLLTTKKRLIKIWKHFTCSANLFIAWGRKVPSVRGVPREGSTRVLSVERLCTSREVLRTLLPFRPRAIWRLRLKARARSRSYTLHYSTCSTRRITHTCVFTPYNLNVVHVRSHYSRDSWIYGVKKTIASIDLRY